MQLCMGVASASGCHSYFLPYLAPVLLIALLLGLQLLLVRDELLLLYIRSDALASPLDKALDKTLGLQTAALKYVSAGFAPPSTHSPIGDALCSRKISANACIQ